MSGNYHFWLEFDLDDYVFVSTVFVMFSCFLRDYMRIYL
jgi:hypothetical protein